MRPTHYFAMLLWSACMLSLAHICARGRDEYLCLARYGRMRMWETTRVEKSRKVRQANGLS